jgi:hypothetical protein
MLTTAAALGGGSASAATVHEHSPQTVTGTVRSLSGGHSCGSAGTTGSFTVPSRKGVFTVDVTPVTMFEEHKTRTTYASVCAGDKVRAVGPLSTNNVVTASEVTLTPPAPQHVAGAVSAVNGSMAAQTCGVASGSGTFSVLWRGATVTVSVTPSTVFAERGDHMPSFANVCVGAKVRATGPISPSGDMGATHVTVIPPPPLHVVGTVTSVKGSSVPGACGTAEAAGSFTLTGHGGVSTVEVSPATVFKERHRNSPSFADVCVGDKVRAAGPEVAGNELAADGVAVIPPPPRQISGVVASIDGSGASGVCGTSGGSGRFTVPKGSSDVTVEVSPSTAFGESGVHAPSFAQVCVGDKVVVTGTTAADGALAAAHVTVVPPRPKKVSGTVVSVDGSSTEGTCGVAGNAGSFTLSTRSATQTVDVAPSTVFSAQGVQTPSFHVVCVGDHVQASGTHPSGHQPLTATDVLVTDAPSQSVRR